MSGTRRGLLVMHYGTPATLQGVEPYYTHIRRGRPPSAEQLQDLVSRYQAIGGPTQLAQISIRQGAGILSGLRRRGIDAKLYVGAKHAAPFVADAVEAMATDGVDDAVGLVLAPHFSTFSVAQYRTYAEEAVCRLRPSMNLRLVERWGTLPALITALSERVLTELGDWPLQETLVVFTAHSLPKRALAEGDPYESELLETSRLVADRIGATSWRFAYQSASATDEPWLEPDILEVLDVARQAGFKRAMACTVGFVSDHLEVQFDLGIEAREHCAKIGLDFRVAETINDDPEVMEALAAEVATAFKTAAP